MQDKRRTWGVSGNHELKYSYVNENEVKSSKVRNIEMTKEEFEKYIKELEMKNKWKNRGIR